MKIKANLILPSTKELKKTCGLDKGGKAQKHIDEFVLYHSEPYEPGKHIHNSGIRGTKIGSGKVIWDDQSANYLYDEKLMVDPFTLKGSFFNPNFGHWSRPDTQKIVDPEGRSLEFHGGGLRGGHWFDRMINNENEFKELEKRIQKVVDGDI